MQQQANTHRSAEYRDLDNNKDQDENQHSCHSGLHGKWDGFGIVEAYRKGFT